MTDSRGVVIEQARKCFRGLPTPPHYDSVWIAPFEQLSGAGYALLLADQYDFGVRNTRSYYTDVQRHAASLVLEFIDSASAEGRVRDWLAGFYFNSALQRIVFAAERLLRGVAVVRCRCGARPEMLEPQRQFGRALKATVRRVDHVRQHGEGEVTSLTELLRQHEGDEYEDEEQFDENHLMRMLRYDVNSRKHAVYVRKRILHRRREVHGHTMTWATAGAERQFRIACQMFQVVVAAFEEVLRWHPEARSDDSSVRTT